MALTQVKTLGIADDAVTGAKIADDTVAEANMANDAIGLAEIKAGTDGQILTFDASGNPSYVGPGSDGQVLTSTGAGSPPAFEAVPAGGATINNATANEIVTVASTTTQLDAEANLTFDGTKVVLGGQTARAIDGYQGTLQIEGTGDTTTSISIVRNSNDNHPPSLNFGKSKGGANGDSTIVADATSLGQITFKAADGTDMECEGARIEAISWSSQAGNNTPTALQFRMNAGAASSTVAGRFVPNGNLEIEDGNLRVASGHGIDFAATSAPNQGSGSSEILKDYEEGTWTPAVRFSSGGTTGITYSGSNNIGVYTKIGRMIMCIGEINLTSKGSSTGYFAITGFPYNEGNYGGNISKAHSSIGHYYNMANWEKWFTLDMFNNDDVAIFRGGSNANTNNDRSNSDVTDTTNIQFAVTYFTDE